MMPAVERLESSPYPAEVRIQRFGGSFPATDERPMAPFMQYGFGDPQQLLDALGLLLLLIDESRQAVLELLQSAYEDAGLEAPPPVLANDLPRILDTLPPKEELLRRLLAEDTLHGHAQIGQLPS
jgi:hypothetical protein